MTTREEEIDTVVKWFSEEMRKKLRENAHKGRWNMCSKQYLMTRLAQEKKELSRALKGENPMEIIREAADVANFALMIADKYSR